MVGTSSTCWPKRSSSTTSSRLPATQGTSRAARPSPSSSGLFLLDAGLSVAEAFAANAFFTAGMVLFEVPTGVVADGFGRRVSYLLGSATLVASTLLYLLMWQLVPRRATFVSLVA